MGFICRCSSDRNSIFFSESHGKHLDCGIDGFSLVNVKYKVSIDSVMSPRQHRASTNILGRILYLYSHTLPTVPQIIRRLKCRSSKITEQGLTFI